MSLGVLRPLGTYYNHLYGLERLIGHMSLGVLEPLGIDYNRL